MGVAELPQLMEALARRASALRDALERSQGNTEGMVGVLGSFDDRLTAVEAAMCPAQVRTDAAQMAHENIDRTIEVAEAILTRQVRDARGLALELSLRKLGIEKLSQDDVQRMQWEALKVKIGNWNQFMQIVVKVLLAGERKTVISFGDAVAKSEKFPEKLFVLLDMYGVMHELQYKVEVIFQGRICSEIREDAFNLTKSLTQTAQETLVDFEEAVEKDTPKNIIQDGNVHPLTIYVTNYVKSLFDYQSTLKILFQQSETGSETEPPLSIVMMKIMQSLRRSEAKYILGDDWIQRHCRIVQQNANLYKRVAWAKTLSLQAASGTGSSTPSDPRSSGVSRAMIKERSLSWFKSLNVQFEELHAKQSQWNIPAQELKEYLRLAVAEVLLPAYWSFITRFGYLVERGKNPRKYIRYSPEQVDQLLGEFFEGRNQVSKSGEN